MELKIGDKVCYQPIQYGACRWENGMIKEIPPHTLDAVRVVYNFAGDWKRFKDFTSELTQVSDLNLGWIPGA